MSIESGGSREIIRLPESICRELLDYAKRQTSGRKSREVPFFVSGTMYPWADPT